MPGGLIEDVIQTGADREQEADRLCQGYRITEQARSLTMPDYFHG